MVFPILILIAAALLVWRLLGKQSPSATAQEETGSGTEFTAEIVRITQVTPHPNADRLELIRFELARTGESGYECVSQKGQWKPGDLAAYFSVDCILPLKHPEFAFLAQRLDGAGKEFYRLRAARLRGVYSQGLLVTAPDTHAFGDRVDQTFGVTYYSPPEPGMKAGPTAPSKKTGPRVHEYKVDSLKKLPRMFAEGDEVVVTEKIHGCNFRFGWVPRKIFGIRFGYRFFVGSHYADKTRSGNSFYGSNVWADAAEKMGLKTKSAAYKGHVFYGELYGFTYTGEAIQKGYSYGQTPTTGPGLVMFDVRKPNGEWLSFYDRLNVCVELGLQHAPLFIAGGVFHPAEVRSLAEGVSQLDGKTQREGVVVENVGGDRRKAKYVGEGYLLAKEAV